MRSYRWFLCIVIVIGSSLLSAKTVNEPARDIPVIADTDIVVVGGASAGITAALEAAKNGARVFVAAPRPYLGEDLCGTYRLWLEPDEIPQTDLEKKLFEKPVVVTPLPSIPFAYTASIASASKHPDTKTPSLLADGKFSSASNQSVQYDGDVQLIIDLGKSRTIGRVWIMAYQRNADFEVAGAKIYFSEDQSQWKFMDEVTNDKLGQGDFEDHPIELSWQGDRTAPRYIRLDIHKTASASRILLGEIIIEPQEKSTPRSVEDSSKQPPIMVRPMQVKYALESALIDAGVSFLYGSYAVDVLHDGDGRPAGVVLVNASGRQAVRARVIIDATARADLARIAGASKYSYPSGYQQFRRVVIHAAGADPVKGLDCRTIATVVPDQRNPGKRYTAYQYTLSLPMKDGSFASFAQAEQLARDLTFSPAAADASEVLFQVPPDPIAGKKHLTGSWPGADQLDLDVLAPAGLDRIWILGGCADISRPAAAELLRPLNFLRVGRRLGKAVASVAASVPSPNAVSLRGNPHSDALAGDIREEVAAGRLGDPNPKKITASVRGIPVLGEYDVVVVGGGTGGAPAGIAAARQGAKTLVLEYLHALGGVSTVGLINKYYHGNRVGFTTEIDEGMKQFGPNPLRPDGWNVEWKIEWYRRELRKAGADLWYAALGCGTLVEGDRVRGVVVATPQGRGVVLAGIVIDATGKADMAASAGAATDYTGRSHIAVQGAGLPPRALGAGYTNTDYTFIDDLDIIDVSSIFTIGREKFKSAWDLGQLPDTRERRRIVGDFIITPLDIWNHRTYPDTIVIARSNFDTHGFTVHPVFLIRQPDLVDIDVDVPYRALLPRGLDGILVTGLGVSAHRDAMPVIRMQPDIQNQGYAMGVAAAMLAKENLPTRRLDIKALQKHLISVGILPDRVLTDTDSFPLAKEKVQRAVSQVVDQFDGIQVLLADPDVSLPLLKQAYAGADNDKAKLVYAQILGMFGDSTGVQTLLSEIAQRSWDTGWRYTGMGQFGMSLSELDSLLIALGRTRDNRALDVILAKARQLNPQNEFSHYRAIAVALETLADPKAAAVLADLLKPPGMTGHAWTDLASVRATIHPSDTDTSARNQSLTELVLARALYRCGDWEGLGTKLLEHYSRDIRGHYARHARAILAEKPSDRKGFTE